MLHKFVQWGVYRYGIGIWHRIYFVVIGKIMIKKISRAYNVTARKFFMLVKKSETSEKLRA